MSNPTDIDVDVHGAELPGVDYDTGTTQEVDENGTENTEE